MRIAYWSWGAYHNPSCSSSEAAHQFPILSDNVSCCTFTEHKYFSRSPRLFPHSFASRSAPRNLQLHQKQSLTRMLANSSIPSFALLPLFIHLRAYIPSPAPWSPRQLDAMLLLREVPARSLKIK